MSAEGSGSGSRESASRRIPPDNQKGSGQATRNRSADPPRNAIVRGRRRKQGSGKYEFIEGFVPAAGRERPERPRRRRGDRLAGLAACRLHRRVGLRVAALCRAGKVRVAKLRATDGGAELLREADRGSQGHDGEGGARLRRGFRQRDGSSPDLGEAPSGKTSHRGDDGRERMRRARSRSVGRSRACALKRAMGPAFLAGNARRHDAEAAG